MKNKNSLKILFALLAVGAVVLFIINQNKNKAAKKVGPMVTPTPGTIGNSGTITAATTIATAAKFPLYMGSRGDEVKVVQRYVGVTADGVWGSQTNTAVAKKLGVTTISNAMYYKILAGNVTTGIFANIFGW